NGDRPSSPQSRLSSRRYLPYLVLARTVSPALCELPNVARPRAPDNGSCSGASFLVSFAGRPQPWLASTLRKCRPSQSFESKPAGTRGSVSIHWVTRRPQPGWTLSECVLSYES